MHAHVGLNRRSYVIMHAHLSHGCTQFGFKETTAPSSSSSSSLSSSSSSSCTPPPSQLPSKSLFFIFFRRCLIIRYVVHYSCLLIEKSLAVTSSSSSSPPLPPSSPSLPFCYWSHDIMSLSESGCAVRSQICCWSESTERSLCSVCKVCF